MSVEITVLGGLKSPTELNATVKQSLEQIAVDLGIEKGVTTKVVMPDESKQISCFEAMTVEELKRELATQLGIDADSFALLDDTGESLSTGVPPAATIRMVPKPRWGGGIPTEKSFWYLFVGSLDRERDIALIKEILFWEQLYHKDYAHVEILVPGSSGEGSRYDYIRKTFEVTSLPSLVLTDRPIDEHANKYIKFSPGLLSESLLGKNYEKLRDVMDYLHNALMLSQSIGKLKKDLMMKHIAAILTRTWTEIKDVVSFTIG